ncbi:hypothetical protein RSAG8_04263, partial [Rhizoctonia solani AG-8 WAC10335]
MSLTRRIHNVHM